MLKGHASARRAPKDSPASTTKRSAGQHSSSCRKYVCDPALQHLHSGRARVAHSNMFLLGRHLQISYSNKSVICEGLL